MKNNIIEIILQEEKRILHESKEIKIWGFPFLFSFMPDKNNSILNFLPTQSKDLEEISERKDEVIAKIKKYLLSKGFDVQYTNKTESSGLSFIIQSHDLTTLIYKMIK